MLDQPTCPRVTQQGGVPWSIVILQIFIKFGVPGKWLQGYWCSFGASLEAKQRWVE